MLKKVNLLNNAVDGVVRAGTTRERARMKLKRSLSNITVQYILNRSSVVLCGIM
jgi:hypothetical protein